ncbi:MAG: ORF6C domain-containing protein [Liquorilactobacillus hordei]|uniref:ORF6C domain-containing protein n=1 Tax=Liquorilactobacillus hordei TaxID=468911 RepID=UPI0039E997BE
MNEIKQVKFNSELILTTEQLSTFYGASPQQIKQNFANNKNKFIKGTHYFELSGEELKQFKSQVENIDLPINKFASHLILWTKRGASRHSKMLGTERAWDMFDELEENYFTPKVVQMSLPSQIKLIAQGYSQLEEDVKEIKENMGLPGNMAYKFTRERNKKVTNVLGGKDSNAYQDRTLRTKTYSTLFKAFKETFLQDRYSDTPISRFSEAIEFVQSWYAPFELQREINIANAQTSMAL